MEAFSQSRIIEPSSAASASSACGGILSKSLDKSARFASKVGLGNEFSLEAVDIFTEVYSVSGCRYRRGFAGGFAVDNYVQKQGDKLSIIFRLFGRCVFRAATAY